MLNRLLPAVALFIWILWPLCNAAAPSQGTPRATFNELIEKAKRANGEQEALQFARAAITASETSVEKEQGLYVLSRIYIEMADYRRAMQYLEIAQEFCIRNNNKLCLGIMKLEIGRCLQFKGELVQSLGYLLNGFQLLEEIRDTPGILRANVYLAEYFRNLAKYPDALAHIHVALAIGRKITVEKDLQMHLYNRAAAIYSETAKVDSSLYYSYLALRISKQENNLKQQATSMNEIAYMQENQGQLRAALLNYQQAEKIWKQTSSKRYRMNALENQSRVYSKMKQYKRSNAMLAGILDTAIASRWYTNCQTIYELMEQNYAGMGDRATSYFYRAKGIEAKLNVYREENMKELEEIKTRYQSEKKELLLKKQQQEIEMVNIHFQDKKRETVVLWIGLSLVLALCVIISYLLIQRSKSIRQLNQRNLIIEETNQQLKGNLAQIESLIQEVHHRVKNNLQFIYSILELEIDANKSTGNIASLVGMQRRIMAMSLVHELLFNKDSNAKIPADNYIHDLIEFLELLLNTPDLNVKFINRVDKVMFDTSQCIAIGMIVSELVSNAFKHAFKAQLNPEIHISITQQVGSPEVELVVADNGLGYAGEKGTGSGLGLRLIHIFTAQLNGTVSTESKNGFLFRFTFPMPV